MKNLDKYEKKIWLLSNEIDTPKPSRIEDSWKDLNQKILIHPSKNTILKKVLKTLNPYFFIYNRIKNYNFNLRYSTALIIISFISLYIYSNSIFTIYDTPRKKLILPDKSIITLNASSSIKYKNKFLTNREIFLKGEAYFNVQKSKKPFTIITDYGSIKVLGTSFNVRSRVDGFEIGVNEGVVEVSNKNSSFLIKKDQMIVVKNKMINKNQITNQPYKEYPGWLNNKLYFNNTPLPEVCAEIERIFKIKVNILTPSLKNITVSGTIETKDIKSVLSSLSLLTKHQFKLKGEICTII